MTNLKDLIKNALGNKQSIDQTLDRLSDIQNNLIKNQSNPVFNKNDKNKILKFYDDIEGIGKTLYRLNNFKQNNMLSQAEDENQKINDIVLKGGISNVKYIWHSENGKNTCDKCKALDGKVFDIEEEVPERPHPNCKCYVEIVDDKKDKPKDENEEPCDCWKFFDNIGDVLNEAEALQYDIFKEKNDIVRLTNNYAGNHSDLIQGLINDIISLEDPLNTLFQTISIFLVNYNEMKDADTHGADKYFHARANCEAAQRGIVGSMIAKAIGDLREFTDNYRNIHEKKYTLEESLKDIQEDLEANQEGRDLGRKYPTANPYDILKHKVPNGLPERYKKY